jgi:hypothetical protein
MLEFARLKQRNQEHSEEKPGKDFNIANGDAKTKKAAVDVLGPDPYSREVGVMARIRAYYQIASIPFLDQVVQAVEAELFIKFRDGLQEDLAAVLQIFGENGRSFPNYC